MRHKRLMILSMASMLFCLLIALPVLAEEGKPVISLTQGEDAQASYQCTLNDPEANEAELQGYLDTIRKLDVFNDDEMKKLEAYFREQDKLYQDFETLRYEQGGTEEELRAFEAKIDASQKPYAALLERLDKAMAANMSDADKEFLEQLSNISADDEKSLEQPCAPGEACRLPSADELEAALQEDIRNVKAMGVLSDEELEAYKVYARKIQGLEEAYNQLNTGSEDDKAIAAALSAIEKLDASVRSLLEKIDRAGTIALNDEDQAEAKAFEDAFGSSDMSLPLMSEKLIAEDVAEVKALKVLTTEELARYEAHLQKSMALEQAYLTLKKDPKADAEALSAARKAMDTHADEILDLYEKIDKALYRSGKNERHP